MFTNTSTSTTTTTTITADNDSDNNGDDEHGRGVFNIMYYVHRRRVMSLESVCLRSLLH